MRLPAVIALLVLSLSVACSTSDAGVGEKLAVVATTTQIGDFARNVGGDDIALTVLLRPNQDAHDFQLEPSQIRAVAEADLILRNGLELDTFLDRALNNSDGVVATLSAGVETQRGGRQGEEAATGVDEHAADPHIWFSVENARRMVENLREALIAASAANAGAYRANAATYLQELEALDGDIRAQLETIPSQCRKLVANHDVLGYYATAFGLEVVGAVIPGTSTEARASAADIGDIVMRIQAEGVPAIFAEASANPDLIRQVGREAGVSVVDDLYGDSLGPPGSDGATYIEMMLANTEKIAGALKACDA